MSVALGGSPAALGGPWTGAVQAAQDRETTRRSIARMTASLLTLMWGTIGAALRRRRRHDFVRTPDS
jgi:hypothetical protein